MMTHHLMINEIFYSIQGESTWMGLPCVFVRLTGCHLRCHYCDTSYAFYQGTRRSVDDVINDVLTYRCSLVEITGGEPLLQPSVHPLMAQLCDKDKTVLLETSGACDISTCDPRVIRIMDLKTPDSGEEQANQWTNLDHLNDRDEVKFVICSRRDYEWARDVTRNHHLAERTKGVLLSPVAPVSEDKHIRGAQGLTLSDLAQWVLADQLPVRVQTQLHKLIFDPLARGV